MATEGGGIYVAVFLSTPSARRATFTLHSFPRGTAISIHALCEEGDGLAILIDRVINISIHALCEEGDSRIWRWSWSKKLFLSTPSARRATCQERV